MELANKTVGLIGFGTIARQVATILHAMGARILASARTHKDTPPYAHFHWASNAEIFANADIISLHCPQTDETKGLVNHELISTMKPGALIVNTARGGLIVEADLAEALRNSRLAGAALDVVDGEPMRENCPLMGVSNCIITPHIAWASRPARKKLLQISCENLSAFIKGKPQNQVN